MQANVLVRDLASPGKKRTVVAQPQFKVFKESQLWPWQRRFLAKARKLDHIYLNSPTGSGKSMPIIWLAADHVRRGGKVAIVVPTHEISVNFKAPQPGCAVELQWTNGTRMQWQPMLPTHEQKTAALLQFLNDAGTGVIVATHQAIALVASEIEKRPSLLDGTLLIIDEAHHVRHDSEVGPSAVDYSRLGIVARAAIARGHGTRIALVTATPFRGDRLPIIEDEMLEHHFAKGRFVRTMEEHLADAKIKGIRIHLVTYKGPLTDYAKAVGKIYREFLPPLHPDTDCGVVWMPHTSSRYNNAAGDTVARKEAQRHALCAELASAGRKALDFVSPATQKAHQQKFCEHREAGLDLEEDTIVAMNLFQEGADHPKADHVISIGYQGSITRMVHRIGRTTRRHPGKERVHVFLVMPRGNDPEDAVEFNRFLKTICMALIGQEIFLTRAQLDMEREDGGDGGGSIRKDPRTEAEKLEDIEAAVEGLAEAVETCEKDSAGRPTPKALGKDLHDAAAAAAARNAADRGGSKLAQKHAHRDAWAIMPRLLHYMAVWFSDEIDVDLVELTRDGYHRSAPISIGSLRRFRKLVLTNRSNVKLDAIQSVDRFVIDNERMPSRAKTSAEERRIYDLYYRLTNERHPWFTPGYKDHLRKIKSRKVSQP